MLNSNTVAIDWDADHVRILAFTRERSGGVKVLRAVREPIPPAVKTDDAQSFGDFLKDLLNRSNVRASGVLYVVGRGKAFLHSLDIPASPENQVANLVRFQLAQELPFAIEESTVDYVITSRNETGKITGVLAAAVRTEYTNFLQHLSRVLGLTTRRIGLKPYANFLAARQSGLLGDSASLLVTLTSKEMEIDLYSPGGGILFSRSIGLGEAGKAGDPASGPFLDQAILQLKRTLQAQAALSGLTSAAKPQQVLIAGGTGWEAGFAAKITEHASLPAKTFNIPTIPDDPGGFCAVYGAAYGFCRSRVEQFDFLYPKRAVDPQAVRARYIRIAVAAVAGVMVLGFILTYTKVAAREHEYARLKRIEKKMNDEQKAFKSFTTQVNQIQNWSDHKVNWLTQLQALTELIPDNKQIYLTHVFMAETQNPNAAADLSIEGLAKSRSVIDQFAQTLAQKGKFKITIGPGNTISGDFPETFKFSLVAEKTKSPPTQMPVKSKPAAAVPKPGQPPTPVITPPMPGKPAPPTSPVKSVNPAMPTPPARLTQPAMPIPPNKPATIPPNYRSHRNAPATGGKP